MHSKQVPTPPPSPLSNNKSYCYTIRNIILRTRIKTASTNSSSLDRANEHTLAQKYTISKLYPNLLHAKFNLQYLKVLRHVTSHVCTKLFRDSLGKPLIILYTTYLQETVKQTENIKLMRGITAGQSGVTELRWPFRMGT